MGSRLVGKRVPFEDSLNVFLPVPPFSKARANLECIAWCNLDSFSKVSSLVAMLSNSGGGARVGIQIVRLCLRMFLSLAMNKGTPRRQWCFGGPIRGCKILGKEGLLRGFLGSWVLSTFEGPKPVFHFGHLLKSFNPGAKLLQFLGGEDLAFIP